MMLIEIGPFVFGFLFGYVTSLSKTPTTLTKAIGVLLGLIGAAIAWVSMPGQSGFVLTYIGLGFSIGIMIGAKLRRSNIGDALGLTVSYHLHHETSPLGVAVIQSLLVGLPLGIFIIWALS
jgi:hypothetical protein